MWREEHLGRAGEDGSASPQKCVRRAERMLIIAGALPSAAAIVVGFCAAFRACSATDRARAWFTYTFVTSLALWISASIWVPVVALTRIPERLWFALEHVGAGRFILMPVLSLLPMIIAELAVSQATLIVWRGVRGWKVGRLAAIGRSLYRSWLLVAVLL